MKNVTVVMPVYNEAECIAGVVWSWLSAVESVSTQFSILVVNDGSRDDTVARLREFDGDSRVQVMDKPNEGHGPSILRGYAQAVGEAQWVFQVDSDGEMPSASFLDLWKRRNDFDFLFGVREGRSQGLSRRIVSVSSRLLVKTLCGAAVRDVNVPYRLMRSECLKQLLPAIPPGTFAPNVVIAGLAASRGFRICNIPVPCRDRETGATSLVSRRLWKAAVRSLAEVGGILLRERRAR